VFARHRSARGSAFADDSVPEQARIGSKGFRGSQEHRWVTVVPEARLEMENWLHHLEADTPSISPLQLKWDQEQLVLSHSGLQWAVEVSDGGAQVQERVIGPALVQPRWSGAVKCTRKNQWRRPKADASRAARIDYKVTKRRQASKNRDTDGANSVPS
jgi:hypothetical protein